MHFKQMIDYPFKQGGAQSLAGYFETLEFAQERIKRMGLSGVEVTDHSVASSMTTNEKPLLGGAHILKYQFDLATATMEIPPIAHRFVPDHIRGEVLEEWQAIQEGAPRLGGINFQTIDLPVSLQMQWEIWAPTPNLIRREITGTLTVKVPFIGKTVEEHIVHKWLPKIVTLESQLAIDWDEKADV